MRHWISICLLCPALLISASCSDSESPTSPGATSTFQGTIAGTGSQTGTLTVTIQAQVAASSASIFHWPLVATLHAQATTVQATASLHLAGGSTIGLSGTYDTTTKALNLTGSGFTFTGVLVGNVASGTYTGPGGVTGGFSTQNTASGTVTAYCGTFVSGGGAIGVLNLQVSASGAVSGVASITIAGVPQIQYITGQVSGTTITIDTSNAGSEMGTIQGGTITGASVSRPWSASTAACQ